MTNYKLFGVLAVIAVIMFSGNVCAEEDWLDANYIASFYSDCSNIREVREKIEFAQMKQQKIVLEISKLEALKKENPEDFETLSYVALSDCYMTEIILEMVISLGENKISNMLRKAEYCLMIAKLSEISGKSEEATMYYQKALWINPELKEVEEDLKRLEK